MESGFFFLDEFIQTWWTLKAHSEMTVRQCEMLSENRVWTELQLAIVKPKYVFFYQFNLSSESNPLACFQIYQLYFFSLPRRPLPLFKGLWKNERKKSIDRPQFEQTTRETFHLGKLKLMKIFQVGLKCGINKLTQQWRICSSVANVLHKIAKSSWISY